ncbi:MAG: rhomboid family intramembrane serine protease [Chlamydiota bacterium]
MKFDLAKILTASFLLISFVAWIVGPGYLGLSWPWFQPYTLVTYAFAGRGSLVDMLLSAFFFWITLSTLLLRLNTKRFCILFFSALLSIGSASLLLLWLTKSFFILMGPAPLIYCLLTTLVLSDKHLKIALLGMLPVPPTTMIVVLLGINTLQNLAAGAYFQIAANLIGVAYAFGVTPFLKKRTHKMR